MGSSGDEGRAGKMVADGGGTGGCRLGGEEEEIFFHFLLLNVDKKYVVLL